MYELATLAAKECKGNFLSHVSYYRPEMSEKVMRSQWIVNEMQNALDAEQFEVYLQPKYNLMSEHPYGAEALIRWKHPERGILSPGLFIPVFEQNGFIGKVDYYMWNKVCALLQKWIRAGFDPGPVSVNVSRVNLYNPNFVESLQRLVFQYAIPPHLLQLELTESAYMDNPSMMENTVRALQNSGFRILMDDFGSGYSSLNTLKDIHVDILKIDMKFLSGNLDVARSRCILASVVRMAGWLNMPVITEGVETAEQAAFLKSIGCGYAQGYYFAHPMPVEDYEQLLSHTRQLPTKIRSDHLFEIHDALWSARPDNELLFNDFDTPAAIYEYDQGQIRSLRCNAAFFRSFGPEFSIDSHLALQEQSCLSPRAISTIASAFSDAAHSHSTCQCDYTIENTDGAKRHVHMTVKYWGFNETAHILFVQFFLVS